MAKGNGSTRTSSSTAPSGLNNANAGGNKVDLSDIYKSSGMLDFDFSKAPSLRDSDFSQDSTYYVSTRPYELDLDVNKVEDFWNRGLTGGESGSQMRAAKDEIIKAVKAGGGGELEHSDISWDKDLGEFVAYHRASRPGDVGKSYWKIDSMKSDVVFRKEKRSSGISQFVQAADKYGNNLNGAYASLDYRVKVKNRGVKAY